MSADPARLTGLSLGNYRVLKRVGEGRTSRVYVAENSRIKTKAAVSVLRRRARESPNDAARFVRSGRIANEIGHDAVVRPFDFGHLENGQPFFLSEYVEGPDLESELQRRGAIPPAFAVGIAVELCDFLVTLHDQGGVYRGVKPSHLILERHRDGNVRLKITGLRYSRTSDCRLTRLGESVGPPGYMAPEQEAGKAVDPRADLYAIGLLIHDLIQGPSGREHRLRGGGLLPLEGVSERLKVVMWRTLRTDPARRYQSARDLQLELKDSPEGQRYLEAENRQGTLLGAELDGDRSRERETRIRLRREEGELRFAAGELRGATAVFREALSLSGNQDLTVRAWLALTILERHRNASEWVPSAERNEAATHFISLAEAYPGSRGLSYARGSLECEPYNDRAMELALKNARALEQERDVAAEAALYARIAPKGPFAAEAKALAERYPGAPAPESARLVAVEYECTKRLADKIVELLAERGASKQQASTVPASPTPTGNHERNLPKVLVGLRLFLILFELLKRVFGPFMFRP